MAGNGVGIKQRRHQEIERRIGQHKDIFPEMPCPETPEREFPPPEMHGGQQHYHRPDNLGEHALGPRGLLQPPRQARKHAGDGQAKDQADQDLQMGEGVHSAAPLSPRPA
ncbi:hypothetical protein D3C76_1641090 [compost metagenome]